MPRPSWPAHTHRPQCTTLFTTRPLCLRLPFFAVLALLWLSAGADGAPATVRVLDLRSAAVKDSGGEGVSRPVTNPPSPQNLPWSACGHYTAAADPHWAVDLGAPRLVERVVLYNRNDCCPERLEGVSLRLGPRWDAPTANPLVASGLRVPPSAPLVVHAHHKGRYLSVARPGASGLTLCAIEVHYYAEDCAALALRGVAHAAFQFLNADYRVDGAHNGLPVYRGPAAEQPQTAPAWSHASTSPAAGAQIVIWREAAAGGVWNVGWAVGDGSRRYGFVTGVPPGAASPYDGRVFLASSWDGRIYANAPAPAAEFEHCPQFEAVSGAYACTVTGAACRRVTRCVAAAAADVPGAASGMPLGALGVTCCDGAGRGSRPDCLASATHLTAQRHCESHGLALCTAAQVRSGAGEATGCAFDEGLVWTATACDGPVLLGTDKSCDESLGLATRLLQRREATLGACETACRGDPRCTHFTYFGGLYECRLFEGCCPQDAMYVTTSKPSETYALGSASRRACARPTQGRTASPSPTHSLSHTSSGTQTIGPTQSHSWTPSASPTSEQTVTTSPSATPPASMSASWTASPAHTHSPTAPDTPTTSATPTHTPGPTPTSRATSTASRSPTPSPSRSPTPTASTRPSPTPTGSSTASATRGPSATPTPTSTRTFEGLTPSSPMALLLDMPVDQFDAAAAEIVRAVVGERLGLPRHRVHILSVTPGSTVVVFHVLVPSTRSDVWVTSKLQGAEPALEAALRTHGLAHAVISYVPRAQTSWTPSAGAAATAACAYRHSSQAFVVEAASGAFGPLWPSSDPAEAARADPVAVAVRLPAPQTSVARPLHADFTATRADCCVFDMHVTATWRLLAPNGTHVLAALQAAGTARVLHGSRLVVSPGALGAEAGVYTVGVEVRHTASGAVLGIGLTNVTVMPTPPQGTVAVVPEAGQALGTAFTLRACEGWGDPAVLRAWVFTVRSSALARPVIVARSASCEAVTPLPVGLPLAIEGCARDAYGGAACGTATATVRSVDLDAGAVQALVADIGALDGAVAQLARASMLLQAIREIRDRAERRWLKEALAQQLRDLGTCGPLVQSADDVRSCAAVTADLAQDGATASDRLRDAAAQMATEALLQGLGLGVPLADLDVQTVAGTLSGLLGSAVAHSRFATRMVRLVAAVAERVCAAAAGAGDPTLRVETAAFGIGCFGLSFAAAAGDTVNVSGGVALVLGPEVVMQAAAAQARTVGVTAVQFAQAFLPSDTQALAPTTVAVVPALSAEVDPPIVLRWATAGTALHSALVATGGDPLAYDLRCVWWAWDAADGGTWNTSGCTTAVQGEAEVVCSCSHLTEFSVALVPKPNVFTGSDVADIDDNVADSPGLVIMQAALLLIAGVLMLLGYAVDKRCQVPAARETLCGIGVDGWKAVKRRHKYLGTFYHPIGTHYTTPQRVATITTLVFTVGVLVSFWFDVASFNTPGRVLQKLLLAFVNLLLLAPLQMLLHLMFANSRSTWVIPGLLQEPLPESPRWYQEAAPPERSGAGPGTPQFLTHRSVCTGRFDDVMRKAKSQGSFRNTALPQWVLAHVQALNHGATLDREDGLLSPAARTSALGPRRDSDTWRRDSDTWHPHDSDRRMPHAPGPLDGTALRQDTPSHSVAPSRRPTPTPAHDLSADRTLNHVNVSLRLDQRPRSIDQDPAARLTSPALGAAVDCDATGDRDSSPNSSSTAELIEHIPNSSSTAELLPDPMDSLGTPTSTTSQSPPRVVAAPRCPPQDGEEYLRSVAARCTRDEPLLAGFALVLIRQQRQQEPFETPEERRLLQDGFRRLFEGAQGPSPKRAVLWRLMLIAIWGQQGPWAVLLLRAALLATHIDLEVVFDQCPGCFEVALRQVTLMAPLLLDRLQCPPVERDDHLQRLRDSLAGLRRDWHNVWVLGPAADAAVDVVEPTEAPPPEGPSPTSGPGARARGACDGAGLCGAACEAPRVQTAVGGKAPATAVPGGSPASHVAADGSPHKAPGDWTWVQLGPRGDCAAKGPPAGPGPPPAPEPPDLQRRRSVPEFSQSPALKCGAVEPHGGGTMSDGSHVRFPGRPLDTQHPLTKTADSLDLRNVWTTTDGGSLRASLSACPHDAPDAAAERAQRRPSTPEPHAKRSSWSNFARGLQPLALPVREPRLQWPGPVRHGHSGQPNSPDNAAAAAAAAVAVTSSVVKEVLVTDRGLDVPRPPPSLPPCPICRWVQGTDAVLHDVPRAVACFALGQPPVPPALTQGLQQRASPWPQFWALFHGWWHGAPAVPRDLRALVRGNRQRCARDVGKELRIRQLLGGGAAAAASRPHRRAPLQPKDRAPGPAPAALPVLAPPCPQHEAAALGPGWVPDPGQCGPSPATGPRRLAGDSSDTAAAATPVPLSVTVNPLLGMPDALFVGPTAGVAQAKTGSVLRPFHTVEHALRHIWKGQSLVLLPGVYAPFKVRNVVATAAHPVRVLALGRVLVVWPKDVPRRKRSPLIKVRGCNHVVFAGLQLKAEDGLGLDIGSDCCNVTMRGMIVEGSHRCYRLPDAEFNNIRFVDCVFHEKEQQCLSRAVRRCEGARLPHWYARIGYAFCALWIGLCIFLQLAMMGAIKRTKDEDHVGMIVLWVLTFAVDIFIVQPMMWPLEWLLLGKRFDPSWILSEPMGIELDLS